MSTARVEMKKDADTSLKTKDVQKVTSTPKTTQQVGKSSLNENTSQSQDIVPKTPNSKRRYYFSEVLLELLIPFLTDEDISSLYKASSLISETMKPLYSRVVFLHSEAISEFVKFIQKSCACPLRLPPPGLTPWQLHEILSNPDNCCRCFQPLVYQPTIELHYSERCCDSFDLCDACSAIQLTNMPTTTECFWPIEINKAKRLFKDQKGLDLFEIIVNRIPIGISKAGNRKFTKGVKAYFKFGVDWILRDSPSAAETLKSALPCPPKNSAAAAMLQVKASLKSVLSLTELPVWIDNHFLIELVRNKKLEVHKDEDFILQVFNKSSTLYDWMKTALAGLHRQTEEFVDVKTLLNAAMRKNLEQVKGKFFAKAQHCSGLLHALESWGEPPTRKFLRDFDDSQPEDIPDVIFRGLPDISTRAIWLQEHAAKLDIPSELLDYFSKTADVDLMHRNLCLRDAAWRWKGIAKILKKNERMFALKDYQTQGWVFGLYATTQSCRYAAETLKIRMELYEILQEFDELSEKSSDTWEKLRKAMKSALYKRSLNDNRVTLLENGTHHLEFRNLWSRLKKTTPVSGSPKPNIYSVRREYRGYYRYPTLVFKDVDNCKDFCNLYLDKTVLSLTTRLSISCITITIVRRQ